MYTQTLTGNTTVYDPHFENHLLQTGIYMPVSKYPDGSRPSRPGSFAETDFSRQARAIVQWPRTSSSRPRANDGTARAATRQACYDGALGARAMHSLRQFGDVGNSGYDDKAYTIMSTYYAGTLGIYATHPTKSRSPDRPTDYVMTQIGRYSLMGSPESYWQGLDAYRNSRDLAKEYREEIIRQANEQYAGFCAQTTPPP